MKFMKGGHEYEHFTNIEVLEKNLVVHPLVTSVKKAATTSEKMKDVSIYDKYGRCTTGSSTRGLWRDCQGARAAGSRARKATEAVMVRATRDDVPGSTSLRSGPRSTNPLPCFRGAARWRKRL